MSRVYRVGTVARLSMDVSIRKYYVGINTYSNHGEGKHLEETVNILIPL